MAEEQEKELKDKVKQVEAKPKPKMLTSWNLWVLSMHKAKDAWERHLKGYGNRVEVENLPVKLQAHLAQPFTRGTFANALEELPRYVLSLGGMNELYVKGEEDGT